MTKFLLVGTIILLALLFVGGIFSPSSPLMWLASSDLLFAFIRAALIAVLTVLIVTNPPRSMMFRVIIGMFSIVLGGLTVVFAQLYTIGIVDAVAFLLVSLASAVEALEMNVEDFKPKRVRIPIKQA
ncbi:MAG: hypothetical protein JWN33_68 [Candidatus Saccharibacteria bacterium]|nr:hypothetical protein [Candidatus Saccharibacteria bacterium]